MKIDFKKLLGAIIVEVKDFSIGFALLFAFLFVGLVLIQMYQL